MKDFLCLSCCYRWSISLQRKTTVLKSRERGDRWAFVEEQEADGGTELSGFPDLGRQRKNRRPTRNTQPKGLPPWFSYQ